MTSIERQRESDDRLAALAEKAFRLGLQHGRAIVRPITREALADRLLGSPRLPNQVSFEELNALRVTYGAAHSVSAAGRRR